MFLRNAWYCAALSHEIGRKPLGRVFLNEPVVLFRTEDGTAVALDDRCCHRRVPLAMGQMEGDNLRCMYHGFLFDPSGRLIWVPGENNIPANAGQRSYPIVEKHGWAWIWMGDADLADSATVPAFHWYDAPGWASFGGCLPMEANYLMMVDNLLDLSHLAFLHIKTIGDEGDINPDLDWERGDDFVRGVRISRDLPASPLFVAMGETKRVDTTKIMTYTPPANVVIEISTVEAGKPLNDPSNPENPQIIILDSMTPETDNSLHYFWGSCRNRRIDDQPFSEMGYQATETAFIEDKDFLEAGQKIIDLDPDSPEVSIAGDEGGLRARSLLDRLIGEEQGTEGTPAG